jgi:HSP20 family molecular chaperone IbpA
MSRPPTVPPLPEDAFGDHSANMSQGPPIAGAPTQSNYSVAPPPATGQAALRQFSDVTTVNIVGAVRDRDARNKEVVFYELTCVSNVSSSTHAWTVHKRFSDFFEFHVKCKENLALEKRGFVTLPDFPSRVNIGALSDNAIEKRRGSLQRYMETFLTRMKEVELEVRCGADGPDDYAESRLNAAIQHFVAFVRGNSLSSIARGIEPSPARHRGDETSRTNLGPSQQFLTDPTFTATPRGEGMGDDIPGVRVMRYGDKAFVAMMFVPGVPAKDLYVMVNPELPRHVIVGGRWNGLAAGAAAKEALMTLLANRSTEEDGEGKSGDAECYYDTLPVGEFEVTFEVPDPFVPAVYFTSLADGVFNVTWAAQM